MTSNEPILPGRLSNPDNLLKTDPRADPRIVETFAPFGFDGAPEPAPVNKDSSYEEILGFCAAAEEGFEGLFMALVDGVQPVENLEKSTKVIKGVDGNDINLYIHKPTNFSGTLPCVYHIHGGGMTLLQASGPLYTYWRDKIAEQGMVVVGVEFRNASGALGNHPFPAGLNDCASGLQWTFDNKSTLGIDKIIVSGESGGGNLTLATTMKAKKDGKSEQIDGTYALCPYISNAWGVKNPALPSLYENDMYFLDCSMMGALAVAYDPELKNASDPLCWPINATKEDLQGLPPHVISVNELDPLRDEGLTFYRTLKKAGVPGYSRVVVGTSHAADVMCIRSIPDVADSTLRDIKGFADTL
jgi:acetyl esterase